MIVFAYYPADPRPRREAEALVKTGSTVDMICLRGPQEKAREVVNGVTVYRLPLRRKRGGKLRYLWQYSYFIFLAFWLVTTLHIRKRYDIVHAHNMPDILVFSLSVPRLSGARVILDLHDPMPEVFIAKYGLAPSHAAIRILCALEKVSIRFAHLILTPNKAFRDLFVARGCPSGKIHIIMNSPDTSVFRPEVAVCGRETPRRHNGFAMMYHGTIVERHGLDTAVRAIAKIKNAIPDLVFHVYGDGEFATSFLALVDELDLNKSVQYHGLVPLEDIAEAIRHIDLGIIPNKLSPFTQINMPTRIFEYLCMGKPVVAPRTKGIRDYFDSSELAFFEPGDADDLAGVILDIYRDPEKRLRMLERGIAVYRKHSWELEAAHLTSLTKRLLEGTDASATEMR